MKKIVLLFFIINTLIFTNCSKTSNTKLKITLRVIIPKKIVRSSGKIIFDTTNEESEIYLNFKNNTLNQAEKIIKNSDISNQINNLSELFESVDNTNLNNIFLKNISVNTDYQNSFIIIYLDCNEEKQRIGKKILNEIAEIYKLTFHKLKQKNDNDTIKLLKNNLSIAKAELIEKEKKYIEFKEKNRLNLALEKRKKNTGNSAKLMEKSAELKNNYLKSKNKLSKSKNELYYYLSYIKPFKIKIATVHRVRSVKDKQKIY